jgi:hypothetical protein
VGVVCSTRLTCTASVGNVCYKPRGGCVQARTLEPEHGKRHLFAHFSVLASRGEGGALAVDYGGSPADGRGTEGSVLNGGVVEGWLTTGIDQQTSTAHIEIVRWSCTEDG